MKVTLDRIEQLRNGSAHIIFITNINTHFTGRFSFTVPKAFASTACRYIVENTFGYGTELDINIITSSENKEVMDITSYFPNNPNSKIVFRLTEYICDKNNE